MKTSSEYLIPALTVENLRNTLTLPAEESRLKHGAEWVERKDS